VESLHDESRTGKENLHGVDLPHVKSAAEFEEWVNKNNLKQIKKGK